MTKKIYIIITQPLHLYPQNFQKKNTYILSRKKYIQTIREKISFDKKNDIY